MTAVLDLFAGPGGWSEACKALGLDEVGVEWDPPTNETATAAGHERVQADVRFYRAPPFLEGLIASPPCQTFSTGGRGNGRRLVDQLVAAVPYVAEGMPPGLALGPPPSATYVEAGALFGMDEGMDPRGALVLEPLRFIRAARPTWVAMEQVPAVLPIWDAYAEALGRLGYHTLSAVVFAEAYGVPQTRRRAVLLAHMERPVSFPRATHSRYYRDGHLDEGMPRWVSMAEALGWGMTTRPYPTVAAGTVAGGTDPMALGGSGARAIVMAERDAGRWVIRTGGVVGEGRPRGLELPAPTLTGVGAAWWERTNGPPRDGRQVTVTEAAVLQGFRPDYPWRGTRSEQFQQVGDAVPPPLAQALLGALCLT